MRPAFVAIAASHRSDVGKWGGRIDELCSQDRELSVVFCQDDLVVIGKNVATRRIGTDGGIVLGCIYPNDPTRHQAISPLIELAIRRSRGAELTRSFWGSYVAFVRCDDASGIDILRSPFGDFPCLFTERDDDVILATDTDLLFQLTAAERTPDWGALSQFLLAEDVTHAQTCVRGVRELLGGMRLFVGGPALLTEALWSPWDHVAPDIAFAEMPAAAARLRKVVFDCVGAIARSQGIPLLRLSGGLDSSIMAAALAANDIEFAALNMVTEGASGDERGFARTVADHLSIRLFERTRKVAAIDVTRSEAGAQPRPGARCFSQASGQMSLDAAAESDGTIVMDGGGGDQVFCALRSARIAADCLMDRANRGPFWETTMALARLAQTSAWRVARRALQVTRRGSPRFAFPTDPRFLAATEIRHAEDSVSHGWLVPPPIALPGKAAQIAMLVQAQTIVHGADAAPGLPLFSPLLSQPIVEHCLRLPTWQWVAGGRDRAVARAAFARLLPPAIVERRTKGTPDSFLFEIYQANRGTIREMLLEGRLMSAGLLDRDALLTVLDKPRSMNGLDCYRILRLVDAEAWTGSL